MLPSRCTTSKSSILRLNSLHRIPVPLPRTRSLLHTISRSKPLSESPYAFSVPRINFRNASVLSIPHYFLRDHLQPQSRPLTTFADNDRPNLFYHLLQPPQGPVYAVSFLSTPPLFLESKTVLGWLPALAFNEGEDAGLNDFKENPAFLKLLHETIQSGLRDEVDDIQKNSAIQVQQGWMHIHDERNIPALGRIGDPDDILASVRVEEGKILPETYQPMPAYRLCTSDGILQLSEGLAKRLQDVLEKEAIADADVTTY